MDGKSKIYPITRVRKYKSAWEELDEFKDWLEECMHDSNFGYCRVCNIPLRAHKTDLFRHRKTPKHLRNMEHPPKSNLNGTPVAQKLSQYKRKKMLEKSGEIDEDSNSLNEEFSFNRNCGEDQKDGFFNTDNAEHDEFNELNVKPNTELIEQNYCKDIKSICHISLNTPKYFVTSHKTPVKQYSNRAQAIKKRKIGDALKFKPKSSCDPLQKSIADANIDFDEDDSVLLSFKAEKLNEQRNTLQNIKNQKYHSVESVDDVYTIEDDNLEESGIRATSAELFGLSIAKDIEGVPPRVFRSIKLRVMQVINEELLKYEAEKN